MSREATVESLISADKDQIVRQQFQMSLRLRRAEQSLGELRATVPLNVQSRHRARTWQE
jgi:hypothetical protein